MHFQDKSAPTWDAGHNNGDNHQTGPQTQGYGFRHIGAFTRTTQMMGQTMQATKDQVFPLMPADFTKLLLW